MSMQSISVIQSAKSKWIPPKWTLSLFMKRTGPSPQPQALETTFKARVQDYMAAHTERMERFKNAIFKQREEFHRTRVGKKKGKTYKVLPKGPVYDVILKKKITKKEDIGGNFEIPCSIGGLKHANALVDQGSDVNVMPYSTYMKLTDERPAETDIDSH
ncbi:hypothetical protein Tco_0992493 [Tanacetum coccineum]|uniref:Uncharacterized protein n=1 Tax=Tanacetum coccineum TaxID=301880 RepID=A0ABQ5F3C3_9ASTR